VSVEIHEFWQLLYLVCGLVFTLNSRKDAFACISRLKSGGDSCWGLISMPQSSLSLKAYSSCEWIFPWWKSQSCWLYSTTWCEPCASGSFMFSSWACETVGWSSS